MDEILNPDFSRGAGPRFAVVNPKQNMNFPIIEILVNNLSALARRQVETGKLVGYYDGF